MPAMEAPSVPIAIIGMSCRFAGGATDPEKLWNLCAEARTGWSEIPSERFNIDGHYHPRPDNLNTVRPFLGQNWRLLTDTDKRERCLLLGGGYWPV